MPPVLSTRLASLTALSSAGTAVPSPSSPLVVLPSRVLFVIGMAMLATSRGAFAPPRISSVGDQLHVAWIDAEGIAAKMVNLPALWNRPSPEQPGNTMGQWRRKLRTPELAIAISEARSGPHPTAVSLLSELSTEPSLNIHTAQFTTLRPNSWAMHHMAPTQPQRPVRPAAPNALPSSASRRRRPTSGSRIDIRRSSRCQC